MDSDSFKWKYKTHEGFGDLVMCGDAEALTGLWVEGSRDDWRDTRECKSRETPAGAEIIDEFHGGAVQ